MANGHVRRIYAVLAAGGLAFGAVGPAMAQRAETTVPAWPSRYRGGTIVPGEVTKVDESRGTVTVETGDGERVMDLRSTTLPGIAPGDRVDLQFVPSGRSPSAVGGAASDPAPVGRILPALPPYQPGAGLQPAPTAPPGG